MMVRNARPQEYRETEQLTREAFWNVYKPGCDEHFVLHTFRGLPEFVPELDCVLCSDDGVLVAHIMYCRAYLETAEGAVREALMFGPVSVLPSYQGKGYGSRLITETMERAERLGFGAVVITGNPAYYRRFGFESCSGRGIRLEGAPAEEEAPYFMVKELRAGFLPDTASVFRIPKAYMADPDAVERYDQQFPPKIKQKRPGQLK